MMNRIIFIIGTFVFTFLLILMSSSGDEFINIITNDKSDIGYNHETNRFAKIYLKPDINSEVLYIVDKRKKVMTSHGTKYFFKVISIEGVNVKNKGYILKDNLIEINSMNN